MVFFFFSPHLDMKYYNSFCILNTVTSTIHWKFHIVIFSIEKGIYLINIHCVGKKKESPLIGRQNCELTFRSKEARMWGEDLKVKAGFSRGSTNVCFTAFQNLTALEKQRKYMILGKHYSFLQNLTFQKIATYLVSSPKNRDLSSA